MKDQPASVAMRAAVRPALLAVALCGALLLGGAAAARADGRIVFTTMSVERCGKLMGCTWKLACGWAGGAPATLLSGAKAGSPSNVEINRSVAVDRFPVAVSCTLWQDTGWFTTSWTKVGTGSMTVPAGGDYTLDVADKTVRIVLAADSLEIAGPLPPPGSERRFIGLFHSVSGGHAVVIGMPWAQFKAKAEELAARGVKLSAMKTYQEGGKRLWAGIFRSSPEAQTLVGDLAWEAFLARHKDLTDNKRMRLLDLELYTAGKQRLAAGLYHEGGALHALRYAVDHKAFLAMWNDLTAQGLRLIDLEVNGVGKKVFYTGVFLAREGGAGLWSDLDWGAFHAKWKSASEGGSALIDIASHLDGKKRLYDGVILGGSLGDDLEPPLATATFAAKWKELLLNKGLRLSVLATFPEE
jgi:polyglycine hydrolase-like protein